VQAAKLKIMGVDVFSAGDWSEQNAEPVRFEDRALGVYKKLTVRDGKLVGAILVGDTSDSHRYMEWLRSERRHQRSASPSAVPAAAADAGSTLR
jgi:nitrite reductase (NADH) large subunit